MDENRFNVYVKLHVAVSMYTLGFMLQVS